MRIKCVPRRVSLILTATALAAASCGSEAPRVTVPLVSTTPTTSAPGGSSSTKVVPTSPPTTVATTPVPSVGPWVPAAGNLAGIESECGNVSLVAARPDRDMVIASIALKGLWASDDGKETWAPLGRGGGSAAITNRGSSIVFDPEKPDRFWQSGIYNGGGVYRTDDNGATFRQLGDIVHLDSVSVDFTDPARRTLLANKHEQTIVYVSRNGGASWTDLSPTLPPGLVSASQPHVIDARTFLLGPADGPAGGIYRTTDGGATWTKTFTGGVLGRPLVASDGSIYWVTIRGGIVGSSDQGQTWTSVAVSGLLSTQAPYLVELPNGEIAGLGRTIVVSQNKRSSFVQVGGAPPIQALGMTYARDRKSFYIWTFSCNREANPVMPNSIMQLRYEAAS